MRCRGITLRKASICKLCRYDKYAHQPEKLALRGKRGDVLNYNPTMATTFLKNSGWTDADKDGKLEKEISRA